MKGTSPLADLKPHVCFCLIFPFAVNKRRKSEDVRPERQRPPLLPVCRAQLIPTSRCYRALPLALLQVHTIKAQAGIITRV